MDSPSWFPIPPVPLKMPDFVVWQGADGLAGGVDTVVHEHCEGGRNAAREHKDAFLEVPERP